MNKRIEITKHLKNFIKNKFDLNKSEIQKSRKFSQNTKNVIKQIYNKINKSYNKFDSDQEKITYENIDFSNKSNLGTSYNYIPEEIKKEIDDSMKVGRIYTFNIKKRIIKVSLILPIDTKKIDIKSKNIQRIISQEFNKIVQKVYIWLYTIESYAHLNCSKVMNIYIILTDSIKTLPRVLGKEIGRVNANTAFTTSCSEKSEIHIYRNEEYFKVLLHETMHNLGLDFSTMNENITTTKIKEIFPVKCEDLRIYESYCEMWAEIINVIFYVYFTSNVNTKNDIDKIINKIEDCLYYESQWSNYQCSKILHFYNLKYTDMFDKSITKSAHRDENYKEKDTHVIAYYVIKSFLMFHVNEFIEWCIDNNDNIISFQKNNTTLQSYCNLIKSLYKIPIFLENINIIEKNISEKKIKEIPFYELNTLRMSLHEF